MGKKKKKGDQKGGGTSDRGKFLHYQQLASQAARDFHAGDQRSSATHYLEAIRALGDSDPYEQNRWQVFTGYTSILREKFFAPSPSDLEALTAFSEDKTELRLFRAEAAFTVGLLRWDAGDRQAAADHYMDAVRIGEKCRRPEDLDRTFMASKVSADGRTLLGLMVRPVRDLLAETVKHAKENLSVLKAPLDHSIEQGGPAMRSDGSEIPRDVRSSVMPVAGAPSITEEQYGRLLSVGGDKCDHCQKTPTELKMTRLSQCAKCKRAFYCSKECARKQWKAGHKEVCRAPGEFKKDDFIRLRGLTSAPQLNGSIVRVVGPAPQPGRWAVRPDGNGPGANTISVAEEKLEQLRPLM